MYKRGRGFKRIIGKKGYFFIIDAFVGSLIIFFSLFMILGSRDTTPKIDTNYDLAEGYASFLINTKVEDYNNPIIKGMIGTKIDNPKNSLMQQTYLFYKNGKLDDATLLLTQTKNIVPSKFNFGVYIKDSHGTTIIYESKAYDKDAVKQVIASKKIVYVTKDSSTIYGPDIMLIKLWI